ncbi:phosphate/phosphite/phosphonate ABC transporter substrate-binding protein [Patulibacter americanus]|uniref:phosphate/phosphite/phosphonate ABC transporter substrate-binding protein n=1 Tax=Patulibacter americanus TaxID=588672 RepID=UPI0003B4B3DF|nr:PhnD/SsuA/transferrin family substrate-binding protein [Patulibacter americanus]
MTHRSSRAVLRAVGAVLAIAALALAGVLAAGPDRTTAAGTTTAAEGEKDTKRFADGSCSATAVRFGVVLSPGDAQGAAAAGRFAHDLSEGLGCGAVVVPYGTQAQLVTALAMHEVEIGQLDPAAVVAADRTVGASPVAAYAVDEDSPARTAAPGLWVPRDSDVRRLEDLEGARIAFGPRLTSGGDVDPRVALLAAGVRTGARGDTSSTFTDGDPQALDALESGAADAAVTRGPVDDRTARGLRRIWTETPPLADVVVLRPGIPNAVRRLILFAIRGLPTASLAPLAARQGIAEPAPLTSVPLDLYAPVAERIDTLTAAGLQP